MKITLFIGSLHGGGAERCACNLSNYLVQSGHKVEILTVSETDSSYELDNKVKVRTLLGRDERKNKLWSNIVRIIRFCAYLLKTNNDVYIVMLPKTTIMLMLFKWMTRAKVIASERSDPHSYSRALAFFLKICSRKVNGFVFQTENARAWYGKAIKKSKTSIIPNAVNPLFIRPRYTGEKRKVIAGVGRLNEKKNFSLLISAFAKLANKYSDYDLIIFGEGNKRKSLEALVSELELNDRVFFPGNVPDIVHEIEKCYMFVLSSNIEGMPNALIEAMALGLPCISTDCPSGGPRFLIQDGINGFLVPVGDMEKMVNAMDILLNNDDLARKMGESASEVKYILSPNVIYAKWMNFIKSVVKNESETHSFFG